MQNKQFKSFEDKAFETFVIQKVEENENEIFFVEYKGEKYWIKKGRKTSSNLFHHISYKLLSFEFLLPVESKCKKESVLFESNKLIAFKEKGINVPEVIGSNESFFVMSDCGETIYTYLRNDNIKEEVFYFYLDEYIKMVANIHNHGLYHGGAQSRNFTYFNEAVFAIDLEDSFDNRVDIKTLQFRDFMLLLLAMTKVDNFKFNYQYVISKYIEASGNNLFLEKLKKLGEKLEFLVRLGSIDWIHSLFPRDVKGFCNLLIELKKLK